MAKATKAPRLSKTERMQAKLPKTLTKEVELVKLKSLQYDESIFETMPTGTVVDEFFSSKGSIPRACNFIVIGSPGSGKTTVLCDILANAQENGAKVLFISAEMNEVDMYEYVQRFPKFGNLDILFLGNYTDENPQLVLESVLQKGYDIVLGDSFVEIQDELKESCYMSTSAAEKYIIDLMCKHNRGENDRKAYTTFLMIQQMTKGGNFVGSNKLKHNTTGMLEIRFDGTSEVAPRYIEFSKNRRGDVGKKLYFTLDKPNHVNYLEEKWDNEEEQRNKMQDEIDQLTKEAKEFEALINGTAINAEVEEVA